jgi:hypothetical protein
MAQVTIYIADDLERELRRRAKRSGKSLSAVMSELVRGQIRPSGWPEGYRDLFGAWQGELPEPEDAPPNEVELDPRPARSRRRR